MSEIVEQFKPKLLRKHFPLFIEILVKDMMLKSIDIRVKARKFLLRAIEIMGKSSFKDIICNFKEGKYEHTYEDRLLLF